MSPESLRPRDEAVANDRKPGRVRYLADAVVTMDERRAVHRPGLVEVEGDRIVAVGPAGSEAASVGGSGTVTELDVGGLLMPGLVNCHGHTAMALLRGAGDGLPLERWLAEAIWPREARLTPEDAYWGMLLGCAELLTAGVTTTCEQYLFPRAVAEAAVESGIRCTLAPAIFDLPDAGPEATWQRCLDVAAEVHAELDGRGGRLSIALGPHGAYTVPEDGLVATAKAATELDALVHIHVAETQAEDAPIRARLGCSVPEYLARIGVFDCRVLAAHSVWLSDDDLDLYRNHDVAVAHCPQSNGKLGSGIARVPDMLARGIRVGLGTDGPASNDNLDLWEEMRLAPLLARARATDAAAMSTSEALALATSGGADALGLDVGRLSPGRRADMVRLDLDDPVFVPGVTEVELVSHLVWAASSRLVTDVWVGGRQVVSGRRCATVDVAEAAAAVASRARRLAQTGA
jgi:5-methylthioadenosine/S-adenosylhomocysteine deaminase